MEDLIVKDAMDACEHCGEVFDHMGTPGVIAAPDTGRITFKQIGENILVVECSYHGVVRVFGAKNKEDLKCVNIAEVQV